MEKTNSLTILLVSIFILKLSDQNMIVEKQHQKLLQQSLKNITNRMHLFLNIVRINRHLTMFQSYIYQFANNILPKSSSLAFKDIRDMI